MAESLASTRAIAPILAVIDGKATTTSNDVATRFGKRHDNVLQSIASVVAQCPAEFNALNFQAVESIDTKGEKRPAYRLTRDGFTLLAMGFTGKRALVFKLAYIDAFNRMEAELLGGQPATPSPSQQQIKSAMHAADAAAREVQRSVFNAVIDGNDNWKHQRLLVSLEALVDPSTALVTPVPANAFVMTSQEITSVVARVGVDLLARIEQECIERLSQGPKTAAPTRVLFRTQASPDKIDAYQRVLRFIHERGADGISNRMIIPKCRTYRAMTTEKRDLLINQMLADKAVYLVPTKTGRGQVIVHTAFLKVDSQISL